jgi:hypothetical protein
MFRRSKSPFDGMSVQELKKAVLAHEVKPKNQLPATTFSEELRGDLLPLQFPKSGEFYQLLESMDEKISLSEVEKSLFRHGMEIVAGFKRMVRDVSKTIDKAPTALNESGRPPQRPSTTMLWNAFSKSNEAIDAEPPEPWELAHNSMTEEFKKATNLNEIETMLRVLGKKCGATLPKPPQQRDR